MSPPTPALPLPPAELCSPPQAAINDRTTHWLLLLLPATRALLCHLPSEVSTPIPSPSRPQALLCSASYLTSSPLPPSRDELLVAMNETVFALMRSRSGWAQCVGGGATVSVEEMKAALRHSALLLSSGSTEIVLTDSPGQHSPQSTRSSLPLSSSRSNHLSPRQTPSWRSRVATSPSSRTSLSGARS